jgi:putative ABC transport system substrate-binding protein
MRRREFIALLGGAATWPVTARAQQPTMPLIGFLLTQPTDLYAHRLRPVRQGLKDAGFVEGENLAIVHLSAEGRYERLPELAADLVRRNVAVIVTGGGAPPALAAKAVTTTIPIVFGVAQDPVSLGLVPNLARPGGNATGVNFFVGELGSKQLALLRELIPAAGRIGLLVNPNNPDTDRTLKDVTAAASAIGLQIDVVQANDSRTIESAFGMLVRNRADALLVGPDSFFVLRRFQLAILAARHAIPAIYNVREYAEAGGLMSYGTNVSDAYRQVGIYVGRILKGAKPAELPVVQSAKFELVINLPSASALGLEVPPTLLARADEVIE